MSQKMERFRDLVRVGSTCWAPHHNSLHCRVIMTVVSRSWDIDPTAIPMDNQEILTKACDFVDWGMRTGFEEKEKPEWVKWKLP